MKTRSNGVVIFVISCVLLAHVPFLTAADTKSAPQAPIPSQIPTAKRIFIGNAGADDAVAGHPTFSGGPDRCYNEFYDAMKNWGRYQIVGTPGEADLVLEADLKVDTAAPLFRLTIRDPKSNTILWRFKLHAEFGMGQVNSDRNFDQAVNRLVARMRSLVEHPSGGAATP